jgi:hypothetical protein
MAVGQAPVFVALAAGDRAGALQLMMITTSESRTASNRQELRVPGSDVDADLAHGLNRHRVDLMRGLGASGADLGLAAR